MNDLRQALRDADPLGREPGMSAADTQRMRAMVLAAAAQPHDGSGWWPQPAVVAATLILAAGAGMILGQRFPSPVETASPAAVAAAPVRRQLQFETRGGTRVIWVLNSELDLGKDPLP